jgi:ABC-type branched-subunit amino acid transport system permease subunit
VGYYVSSLAVYWIVGCIAALGLNLQFGVGGILNFAFILFQATGAYVAAMLTLGPDTAFGGFQKYLFGAHVPFPLPLLGGALAAALLSLAIGAVGLRKLRRDYQAMVMLVISVIATTIAEGDRSLVNGSPGLALVPRPFPSLDSLSQTAFGFAYVGLSLVFLIITYLIVWRITESPWGRTVRAARDAERAAAALGKNVVSLHLTVFVIGGAIAGLSGALLVQFISAWSPPGWYFQETFVFFTAVIVGGTGNRLGVIFGTLLIVVVIGEGSTYLPQFGPTPVFVASMQWVFIGLAILVFLWFRPEGVFPERVRRLREKPPR